MCFWKYTRNGDFHTDAPKSTDAGWRNTRPSRRSYILNSFAVFSRCTAPADTRSNLIAFRGSTTRATRGQSPPRITAFSKGTWLRFVFRTGSEGETEAGRKPVEERAERKSCLSEAMSRTVDEEIKFCHAELSVERDPSVLRRYRDERRECVRCHKTS